jgi:hypothetical protein
MPTAHLDSNLRIFVPNGTISEDLGVCLDSTAGQVRLAGLGDTPIGVCRENITYDSVAYVKVRLWAKNGTVKITQGAAITPYRPLKMGANGKVIEASDGDPIIGWKISTDTGVDGDVIEVHDFYQTNTTAPISMTGATGSADGASGLVPKPSAGQQSKFLKGDGSWDDPTATTGDFLKHYNSLHADATISTGEVGVTFGDFTIPSDKTLTIEGDFFNINY